MDKYVIDKIGFWVLFVLLFITGAFFFCLLNSDIDRMTTEVEELRGEIKEIGKKAYATEGKLDDYRSDTYVNIEMIDGVLAISGDRRMSDVVEAIIEHLNISFIENKGISVYEVENPWKGE